MTVSDSPVRHTGATPAHRPSALARAQSIWRNRRILRVLIVRDLKVRYSDSVLGFLWTLLDPLLLTMVYWLVFGFIISRGAINEQPYLLWLLTGILPFQWTSHVLGDAGRLLGNDAKLVTSSSLPREIWVLRSVASRFIEFLFTIPITAGAMLIYGIAPTKYLWLVPVGFVVQGIFNVGLGLGLSPLSMLYPDIQRIVRVFAQMYRYLSPVIYGIVTLKDTLVEQDLPSWILTVYKLNPLAGILDLYHAVAFPLNSSGASLLGDAAIISLVIFFLGWWIFRRLEPRVLKEL